MRSQHDGGDLPSGILGTAESTGSTIPIAGRFAEATALVGMNDRAGRCRPRGQSPRAGVRGCQLRVSVPDLAVQRARYRRRGGGWHDAAHPADALRRLRRHCLAGGAGLDL